MTCDRGEQQELEFLMVKALLERRIIEHIDRELTASGGVMPLNLDDCEVWRRFWDTLPSHLGDPNEPEYVFLAENLPT